MSRTVLLSQLLDEADGLASEILDWGEVAIASGRPVLEAQSEAWSKWGNQVISLTTQIEGQGGDVPLLFNTILDWAVVRGSVEGSDVGRGVDWVVLGALALMAVLVR